MSGVRWVPAMRMFQQEEITAATEIVLPMPLTATEEETLVSRISQRSDRDIPLFLQLWFLEHF